MKHNFILAILGFIACYISNQSYASEQYPDAAVTADCNTLLSNENFIKKFDIQLNDVKNNLDFIHSKIMSQQLASNNNYSNSLNEKDKLIYNNQLNKLKALEKNNTFVINEIEIAFIHYTLAREMGYDYNLDFCKQSNYLSTNMNEIRAQALSNNQFIAIFFYEMNQTMNYIHNYFLTKINNNNYKIKILDGNMELKPNTEYGNGLNNLNSVK